MVLRIAIWVICIGNISAQINLATTSRRTTEPWSTSAEPRESTTEQWTTTSSTSSPPGCGDLQLSGDSGNLVSPNYPYNYPHDLNCGWLITVPPSNTVHLTFLLIDMQSDTFCAHDYVAVYDGLNTSAPLLGEHCGNFLPYSLVHVSTSNQMFVHMLTDSSISRGGFYATYSINSFRPSNQHCGGEVGGGTGILMSPNYPNSYPNDIECWWLVTVVSSEIVNFTLFDFDIENSTDCENDYLSIYDAMDMRPLVQRKCGDLSSSQVSFTSSSNRMFVRMTTDSSGTGSGFYASFRGQDSPSFSQRCGGELSGETGLLTSAFYPGSYPILSSCRWLITVQASSYVSLFFLKFDIHSSEGCSSHYVAIYDGPNGSFPLITKKCGIEIFPPTFYYSTSNQMYVDMVADDPSGSGSGFVARYNERTTTPSPTTSSSPASTATPCGGQLFGNSGELISPNYPAKYPNNLDCRWLITVQFSQTIQLNFVYFNIEIGINCNFDYVAVYDGSNIFSTRLLKNCGSTLPITVFSSTNQMYVRFVTDTSATFGGFRAMYNINSDATSTTSTLTSTSTKDSTSPSTSSPSPTSTPLSTSTEDYSSTSTSTPCGGPLFGESGELTSPNYPSSYPNSVDCRWLITVPSSQIVYLTFLDFNIEQESNCNYDYVAVYDSSSIFGSRILKVCGLSLPNPVSSSTNQMYVRFVTDRSVTQRGFKAIYSVNIDPTSAPLPTSTEDSTSTSTSSRPATSTFLPLSTEASMSTSTSTSTSTPCGGLLFGESGQLTSSNYPRSYPNNVDCRWLITVPSSETIYLTFLDFDLEQHPNCIYDYVAIHDGSGISSRQVLKACGVSTPRRILSSTNQLYVHFRTDLSVTRGGFRATYSVNGSAPSNLTCGGYLTEDTGILSSPNFPDNYPDSMGCTWIITQSFQSTVYLTFLDFDVQSSTNCLNDYVAVYDGRSRFSPLIVRHCGSSLPVPASYESTSNVMYVRFSSDSSINGRGFRASYLSNSNTTTSISSLPTSTSMSISTTATPCGGSLFGESGELTSPNYPSFYPHDVDCRWLITVPFSQTVYLTILDFNLQNDSSCRSDYVAVYDGRSIFSPLIVRHCGSSLPVPLFYESTANVMYVRFRSDSSIRGRGFRAIYISNSNSTSSPNDTSCVSELSGLAGLVTSENYPNNYPHQWNCGWLITAPSSYYVNLVFLDFDLESHSTCSYDEVTVYDGPDNRATQLVKYCGSVLPNPASYLSTTNQLYIHMKTDTSSARRGFAARYSVTRQRPFNQNCNGNLTGTSGQVTSPNHPDNYPDASRCGWLITVPSPHTVNLTFIVFDLEQSTGCRLDGVTLYDGPDISSSVIASLCGRSLPSPASYYSSSNQMYIRMTADGSVTGAGFMANYSASDFESRADTGFVTSLNYPNPYPMDDDSNWYITVSSTDRVYLVFLDFDVEGSCDCIYDSVAIYDGAITTTSLLEQYCGNTLPNPVTSSSNRMFVRMRSDESFGGKGFKAIYYAKNCGGDLSGLSGSFTSPNYPNNYPDSSNCLWRIVVPVGYHIQLTIHDLHLPTEVDCSRNSVEIYGGPDESSKLLTALCRNQTTSQVITTTENTVIVRFKGDMGNKGFSASYEALTEGCGGEMSTASGVLFSQNYPQDYPHNAYCMWRISAPTGFSIQLNFTNFDLEPHSTCAYDLLDVYDGSLTRSNRLMQHCGSDLPSPSRIQSTSNVMYVRMRTDYTGSANGFRAEYISVCGGVLSEESGMIKSPSQPIPYPESDKCVWKIVTQPQYRIELTITDLNLEKDNNCQHGKLEVFGGQNLTSPRLTTLCHVQSSPQVITSTENGMIVKFKADNYGNGFSASYRRVSEKCGGMYSAQSGVVMATIPQQIDFRAQNCHWLITVEARRSVTLSFTGFDVGVSYRGFCYIGSVKILDGDTLEGMELLRHCGSNLPPGNSYTSSSHQLYISMETFFYTIDTGFTAEYTTSESYRCGRRGRVRRGSYIHGGSRAVQFDAPWQASFQLTGLKNITGFFCGGTILSESWILSAAHCFVSKDACAVNVTVGHISLNSSEPGQQSFEVEEVIIHESYQNRTRNDYDIALVKVKPVDNHSILFSEYVEPACLPSPDADYTPGKECYISGWGNTENGDSNYLMHANVSLIHTLVCNGTDYHDGRITSTMVCAKGIDNGTFACYGDSGGPLVCPDGGRYAVYGAVSWGDSCRNRSYPDVYTNVRFFLDWINENTGL